jgi:hypothetical protein
MAIESYLSSLDQKKHNFNSDDKATKAMEDYFLN